MLDYMTRNVAESRLFMAMNGEKTVLEKLDESGTDVRGCLNTLTTAQPSPLAKANPQNSTLVDIKAMDP